MDIAVDNDDGIETRDQSFFVPGIDPRKDRRKIVEKRLRKEIHIGFSCYERKTFYHEKEFT